MHKGNRSVKKTESSIVSLVFWYMLVPGWVRSNEATLTSSLLCSPLFVLLKQTQGAAGWSLPGHSLLCKQSSAAAVWGSRPLSAQPRQGKPTAVRATGDQLNAVRAVEFWWEGLFRFYFSGVMIRGGKLLPSCGPTHVNEWSGPWQMVKFKPSEIISTPIAETRGEKKKLVQLVLIETFHASDLFSMFRLLLSSPL